MLYFCVHTIDAPVSHRWTKAHELLLQQEIRKDLLAVVVKESEAMLRSANLLTFKSRKFIPLL